jgi:hypothetical protein
MRLHRCAVTVTITVKSGLIIVWSKFLWHDMYPHQPHSASEWMTSPLVTSLAISCNRLQSLALETKAPSTWLGVEVLPNVLSTSTSSICWQIGMHCSYLMHLFANKSESSLIAPLLDYLFGLQRVSVFALVCVTESLP